MEIKDSKGGGDGTPKPTTLCNENIQDELFHES